MEFNELEQVFQSQSISGFFNQTLNQAVVIVNPGEKQNILDNLQNSFEIIIFDLVILTNMFSSNP